MVCSTHLPMSLLVQAFCEMTSHKLQQKQTQLILFPKGILIARKKVLRNQGREKPQSLTLLIFVS